MAVAVRAARLPQLPCRSLPEHSYAKLKQRDDKSLVLTFLDWASVPLSGLNVPVLCWFLDAGNDETLGRLSWPASEKRQCTKSRECGTRQCSECYGDRMLVAVSMVDAALARGDVHARMQVSPGECNGHLGGHTEFINGRLLN
jgi:hypothetical protein